MNANALEAQLNLVRAQFAQGLHLRLEALEAALAADPAEALRLAHKLNGTSGTMGFGAVSEAADALERWLQRGGPRDPAEEASLLGALREATAAAAASWACRDAGEVP